MEKKLRIGIIGTGGIAHAHMRAYLQLPDVEVVAGADIVKGKAREFFDEFDMPQALAFDSAEEMLRSVELDGVSICTYNQTHAECTVAALEAGLDVLLEKPMCVTMDQAAEILRAEKKSGKFVTRTPRRSRRSCPPAFWATFTTYRPAAAVVAVFRDAPSSKRRPQALAPWQISAATAWICL